MIYGKAPRVRGYILRLLINFTFSFALELICTGYTYSVANHITSPAVILSMIQPWVGFLGTIWFIEEKNIWKRVGYVATTALAYGCGTILIMNYFPGILNG